ncbi:Gp15 family bacteriophage protein [Vagococcus fluvialis]|uniref:Gp15 family bacteriophage protein n=1 Tax=Vagococcus fluvialis TaxID=2738 RepID=UPI003B5C6953
MYSIYREKNDMLEINGVEYRINASFDNILNLIDLLAEKIPDQQKLDIAIQLLFGVDMHIELSEKYQVFNHIMDEYVNQKVEKPVKIDLEGNEMPIAEYDEDRKAYYSLQHDAKYIYAAFRQAYNINLFEEQGKLHWFDFQALLTSLPEDTKFKEIIKIRSWKPKKGDSSEFKAAMREAQKQVELPEQEGVNDE